MDNTVRDSQQIGCNDSQGSGSFERTVFLRWWWQKPDLGVVRNNQVMRKWVQPTLNFKMITCEWEDEKSEKWSVTQGLTKSLFCFNMEETQLCLMLVGKKGLHRNFTPCIYTHIFLKGSFVIFHVFVV